MNNLTEKKQKNFWFFSISCMVYACFYTLCTYQNPGGIARPFLLAGSLWFFYFCIKKLGLSLRKGSVFYIVMIMLLGISTALTADDTIITMNKMGSFVLMMSFFLHQFFADENWSFGTYFCHILGCLFRPIGEIISPLTDFLACRRMKRTKIVEGAAQMSAPKKESKAVYVVLGLVISLPILCIVGLLLLSADAAFAGVFEKILYVDFWNFDGLKFIWNVGWMMILMFFFSYGLTSFLCKRKYKDMPQERVQTDALLAITILVPLALLYVIFCGFQIFCLFGGNFHMEGMTYAEYAREGFFELMVVCVINLVMVLLGYAYFRKNALLNALLTVVSVCTYVMIASSAMRMILYIKYYYLTFLRIFVLWTLVVLAILLVGVIISIYNRRFPLFRYSMVVVTLCYLVLSFSHPDYWIAKCNISQIGNENSDYFESSGYTDMAYLMRLSEDAAPVLVEFLQDFEEYGEEHEEYYFSKIKRSYREMGFRSFNLSTYMAYQYLYD